MHGVKDPSRRYQPPFFFSFSFFLFFFSFLSLSFLFFLLSGSTEPASPLPLISLPLSILFGQTASLLSLSLSAKPPRRLPRRRDGARPSSGFAGPGLTLADLRSPPPSPHPSPSHSLSLFLPGPTSHSQIRRRLPRIRPARARSGLPARTLLRIRPTRTGPAVFSGACSHGAVNRQRGASEWLSRLPKLTAPCGTSPTPPAVGARSSPSRVHGLTSLSHRRLARSSAAPYGLSSLATACSRPAALYYYQHGTRQVGYCTTAPVLRSPLCLAPSTHEDCLMKTREMCLYFLAIPTFCGHLGRSRTVMVRSINFCSAQETRGRRNITYGDVQMAHGI